MASGSFQFKPFTIHQQKSAFKVGTDSVILGAWAQLEGANHILDIGTGTGLLALMMASRFQNAIITAIEIDPDSALEAEQNAANSPFGSRIKIIHDDIKTWAFEQAVGNFDGIISNPPYFDDDLKNPDQRKASTRYTTTLNLKELAMGVSHLLNKEGQFYTILPAVQFEAFTRLAEEASLQLVKKLSVKNKPSGAVIRIAGCISKTKMECSQSTLCIRDERDNFSEDYIHLTKDFYIKNLNQK